MVWEEMLAGIGVGIASNTIYDFVKSKVSLPPKELAKAIVTEFPQISIDNAEIIATKAIHLAANGGNVVVNQSHITAGTSATISSAAGNSFSVQNQSKISAKSSSINVGQGASIHGNGGAVIHQDADGNITFGFKK